ncbi:MAG: class I SAM-dependent methyltransferase [Phycisphaerae bacterium]
MVIHRSCPVVESVTWQDYWQRCRRFFEADTRLVHRLNRLKFAWPSFLRRPKSKRRQLAYCWRYFGLLHHTLRVARTEPRRGDPLPVLHRILAFATFTVEIRGSPGKAAGLVTNRNPVYQLGRLPPNAPPPTPRHVPLVLPLGADAPFYHYRQIRLEKNSGTTLLLCPSVELSDRSKSFGPIDRLTRLISRKPDPYWKPRSRLLARRVLAPLFRMWRPPRQPQQRLSELTILDLGAGTGHLAATAWRYLCRSFPPSRRPRVAIHFVDASGPSFGRSFGVTREADDIAHVEWTKADYRALLDDDNWLGANGPFDWVFLCRLLDNASNFIVEQIEVLDDRTAGDSFRCKPHWCLAPRRQPHGISELAVRTARRNTLSGTLMPQFSLSDYFGAMQAVVTKDLDAAHPKLQHLPVRCFNPASLTTISGRSIVAQIMKVASAIVIEDLDLMPEYLSTHREQFGLAGTAAIHCVSDGFATESQQYVITRPEWADRLRGVRLW